LTIEDNIFEIKSTIGNANFGGNEFDELILKHVLAEIERYYNRDLSGNIRAICRLRAACENAKRILSSSTQANIEIDSLFDGINFNATITRAKFEELCADLFRTTIDFIEKALRDARMDKNQVDEIVLVGGSTRIPKIQELLSDFFSGKVLNKSINPDEAATCGAAIYAAILSGDKSENVQDLLLLDIAPFSLGIKTSRGLMSPLIRRNTTLPTKTSQTFSIQRWVQIYEGEHRTAARNNFLGQFRISRNVSQTEVTFDVDSNGIIKVSAEEKVGFFLYYIFMISF
jgi:L1 cell adhesion molecule like protein